MRDGEDGEHEDRGRERQIGRQLIIRVGLRPIAEQRDEIGESEDHGLGDEQLGEDGQKGRAAANGAGEATAASAETIPIRIVMPFSS